MSQTKPGAEPDEIAGRYQIIKKLGAGAFGTVYKAKDRLLGRMVAIKTIRLEGLAAAGASLEELLERFTREAQVSAQLKHPNIVTIYDIGNADGLTYLAMEFIDGVGLDRLIASEGRLELERAASIGAQVADALDFAHKNSVVHRDIKPANIMIEAGDRVKVTDFGIAKVIDSGEHLTMTGSLLGTPSYMSPEQARGGVIDGRSDLFAVGCVVYEMLAGKKAFRGDSITGLIFKIITEDPPSLHEIDPTIPDEMLRVVSKAVSKPPEKRYQSGLELAQDLLSMTRAGSVPTIRQAEMGTAAGVAGATPTVVSTPTVGAAAPTMVSAAAPAPTRLIPTPTPPPPPKGAARQASPPPVPRPDAPRKGGSGMGLVIGLLLVGGFVLLAAGGGVWWFFFRHHGTDVTQNEPGTLTASVSPGSVPASERPPDSTPPTQPPDTQPSSSLAPGTLAASLPPPVTQPSVPPPPASYENRPPETTPPSKRPTTQRDTPPKPETGGDDYAFLDEEQADMNGAEAGQRVAGSFRNGQGGPTTSYGTSAHLNARPRSPRDLNMRERPAVAVLRHLINAEEGYHSKHSKYASLEDLKAAHMLFLDVPVQAWSFVRKNYRFELKVESDGFAATATPMGVGLRPFHGSDAGFIETGVD